MLHTNHGELALIFDTFCRVWGAGGQATLSTRTEGGKLLANLELQLGSPAASRPQPLHPQQHRSKFASGRPEATQRRHRRGPAAQAKSRARAAAHQAALAASSTAPVSGTSPAAASAASSVTPASSAVILTATSAASAVSPAASAVSPATAAVTPANSAVTSTATPAVSAANPVDSPAPPAPGASQTVCLLKCEHCDLFFHSMYDLMKHLKTDHKNLSLKNLEITYPDILHTNDCNLTKSVSRPSVRMKKYLHGPNLEPDRWTWRMPMCVKVE